MSAIAHSPRRITGAVLLILLVIACAWWVIATPRLPHVTVGSVDASAPVAATPLGSLTGWARELATHPHAATVTYAHSSAAVQRVRGAELVCPTHADGCVMLLLPSGRLLAASGPHAKTRLEERR